MSQLRDWTPARWFEEAARCYVEAHQGCPWCAGSYRVFKSERGGRVDYYCNCCDFFVSHEQEADRHYAVPGREETAVA